MTSGSRNNRSFLRRMARVCIFIHAALFIIFISALVLIPNESPVKTGRPPEGSCHWRVYGIISLDCNFPPYDRLNDILQYVLFGWLGETLTWGYGPLRTLGKLFKKLAEGEIVWVLA